MKKLFLIWLILPLSSVSAQGLTPTDVFPLLEPLKIAAVLPNQLINLADKLDTPAGFLSQPQNFAFSLPSSIPTHPHYIETDQSGKIALLYLVVPPSKAALAQGLLDTLGKPEVVSNYPPGETQSSFPSKGITFITNLQTGLITAIRKYPPMDPPVFSQLVITPTSVPSPIPTPTTPTNTLFPLAIAGTVLVVVILLVLLFLTRKK